MAFLDQTDRRLLRLAGPAFLTLAAEPIYVLVDTAIVGHIGTNELGGLAIAGTVLSTLTWLIAFLATGVTTQVAQHRGAGDEAEAKRAVGQGLYVAVFLGLLIAAIAGIPSRTVAQWVGGNNEVLNAAVSYLRVASLGLPAIALTLLALGWFRGVEDLRLPVRVAIGANIANVFLEMLFVWVFRWGISGSAAATVIVQWCTVGVYALTLRRVVVVGRPDTAAIRRLLKIGGAMLIRTGLMVSTIGAATWLASQVSVVALGAHQIGVQIYFFFALMVDALAVSAQSVFANQLGSTSPEGLSQLWPVTKRLIRLGLIAGCVLAAVLLVGSPFLGHLFSADPAVLHRSVGVLLWCALMQITGAVVFVLDGVLMGANLFGRLALGAAAAAAAFWTLALLQRNGVVGLKGLNGVWIALNAWMAVRVVGNLAIAKRFLSPKT